MANTTVERTDGAATLTPQVRNVLLALIVGGIAAILDSTMVTIALHTLAASLHSTYGAIQWVTTGYLLAMAVAIPVTGWAESRGAAGASGWPRWCSSSPDRPVRAGLE